MTDIDLGIEGIEGPVEIGRGGFGIVYRAIESELDRTVAIKVLLGEFDERARLRFDRERRAMGALSGHANIVTVYRSGFSANGRPYLLMEYLGGGSIGDRLRRKGRLPWNDVVQLGIEIGRALATAHSAGVLHRDVKPGNILLGMTGVAKLGDFGIARLHGAPETRSAVITASVAHAPPEVLGGSRPDERADVYSLASTLFELAWGAPAFVGPDDESLVPMLSRIVMDAPPDLRAVGVPGSIAGVIGVAMAKDRDRRFASANDFADALDRARSETLGTSSNSSMTGSDRGATIAVPTEGPPAFAGPAFTSPPRPSSSPGKRSASLVFVAAVVAVLGVVAIAVAVTRPNAGPEAAVTLQSSNAGDETTTTAPASTTLEATGIDGTAAQESAPPITTDVAAPDTTVAPTSPPTTQRTATTPLAESPVAHTQQVVNSNGAISVLVPAGWDEQTVDATSLIATPDLEAALADDWVKGVALQAVRNTPEQNPGGFDPDVTLNQLIADSGCVVRERGPFASSVFGGSYAVLDRCGDSTLSSYFLVAAPADLSMVVLVAVSFESPAEDVIVQLILDSVVWDIGPLP